MKIQRRLYLAFLCCTFLLRCSLAFVTPGPSFSSIARNTNIQQAPAPATATALTRGTTTPTITSLQVVRTYDEDVRQARKRTNNQKRKWLTNKSRGRSPDEVQDNLRRAQETELRLARALDFLQDIRSDTENMNSGSGSGADSHDFPSVRDCNGALAIYGDLGHLKRALHLFGQMRKATAAVSTYSSASQSSSRLYLVPPAPTLVTYSTLMSRAVSLGKERVALRLWRLMISSPSFYTNKAKTDNKFGAPIVPDIRAVNILMNCFAKMGDHASAKRLMEQIYDGKVVPYHTRTEKNGVISGIDDGVFGSASGAEELGLDLIKVVPKMEPNIVTYNTWIDACHRAGDLDAGLAALEQMKQTTDILPDIFTYTSLISSVARRATRSSGKSDPDLAFELFDEMAYYKIKANGMAYCALIDVCGRCGRSDLALKGLRLMLREKAQRKHEDRQRQNNRIQMSRGQYFKLANEVGAWTAAIDACGKAGRLETAIRLFQTMPKFDVYPNIYTCGALTDCLLKSNTENYLDECLNVLRYMKTEGIEPSEVMYTSLITSASKLAKQANAERGEIVLTDFGDRTGVSLSDNVNETQDRMKALDVYTELILSLSNQDAAGNVNPKMNQYQGKADVSDELLMKVFLVLQEMKASGADPDIACYNAILRACARAGDASKLKDVMRRIELDGLVPNPTTWKEIIRGASIARDSAMVVQMWQMALSQEHDTLEGNFSEKWTPGIEEFDFLISSYIREAAKAPERMEYLYSKVLDAYIGVANGEKSFGFHHVDLDDVKKKPRAMKMITQATTFLRSTCTHADALHLPVLQANIRQVERDLGLAPLK